MRGHLEMWPLRQRLRRAGFVPQQFSYASLALPAERNVERLAEVLDRLDGRPYHLVAHSLGGIIAMMALQRHGHAGLQRVVALGAPLNGSAVAQRLNRSAATRWVLGRSRSALLRGAPTLPSGIEVGAIAGTRACGIGALAGAANGPGDGSVSVAETRATGLADHITLPLSHSGLQLSALAAQYVIRFLRNGHFSATAVRPS